MLPHFVKDDSKNQRKDNNDSNHGNCDTHSSINTPATRIAFIPIAIVIGCKGTEEDI